MQIPAVIKGMNSNVSPLIHPQDQPEILLGCHNNYRIGAITKDTGYSVVDAQILAGKSVLGLYNFRQNSSTQKMLATIDDATSDDTQLFYKTSAGTWTEITDAETAWANKANMNVEFESFIGYCFMVGYGATDGFLPVASLTGTTFSTTQNVTNMPQAKYIVKGDSRLYIANCYYGGTTAEPFRIYKSDIPVAGAITWTPATNYLDVDYSEQIMGLTYAWKKVIAFTEYKTWMYDGSTWDDPWEYGCSAHRTIKRHGPYLIWANRDGVWASTGGQPQCISGEIEKFFRAANPLTLFAEVVDEDYWLYLGNVTVDGITYSNLVAVFNIGKSNWWIRELGHTIKTLARYNDSGALRLYAGSSDGYVYNKGKYSDSTLLTADVTLPINSMFVLAPIVLSTIEKLKKLKAIIAYADRAGGLKLKARIIDANTRVLTPFMPLGELTQYINSFDVEADAGMIIQVAGAEYGTKPYWSFLGYAMNIDLYGNILK